MPLLLKYFISRTQKKYFGEQAFKNKQYSKKEEGKTTVDYVPDNQNKKNSDVGEYIDFEEIDKDDNNK